MTEIKLKPCPFCGGRAELDEIGLIYRVICMRCLSKSSSCGYRRDAIDAWNTRVSEKDEKGDDNNVKTDNYC
ncbi:MAG: Lar family restriction alleviation protein [Oscillospiraceae bacterium]|nr:Lar family restriction alleviation protein [Oscillospiraceae bacterium]